MGMQTPRERFAQKNVVAAPEPQAALDRAQVGRSPAIGEKGRIDGSEQGSGRSRAVENDARPLNLGEGARDARDRIQQ